jgi:hypothetical protein
MSNSCETLVNRELYKHIDDDGKRGTLINFKALKFDNSRVVTAGLSKLWWCEEKQSFIPTKNGNVFTAELDGWEGVGEAITKAYEEAKKLCNERGYNASVGHAMCNAVAVANDGAKRRRLVDAVDGKENGECAADDECEHDECVDGGSNSGGEEKKSQKECQASAAGKQRAYKRGPYKPRKSKLVDIKSSGENVAIITTSNGDSAAAATTTTSIAAEAVATASLC